MYDVKLYVTRTRMFVQTSNLNLERENVEYGQVQPGLYKRHFRLLYTYTMYSSVLSELTLKSWPLSSDSLHEPEISVHGPFIDMLWVRLGCSQK